jgi:lipopolysaccharide exporter
VSDQLARSAGSALTWRAAQLFIGKGLLLGRYLVLALLLPPADFGVYAIAAVTLDFVLGVTDFGIGRALLQQGGRDERQYHAAWTLGLLRGAAITLVLLLAAPLIGALFTEARSIGVLQLIAIRPVLGALSSIKVVELERNLDFRRLAFISIPMELMSAAVAITLAPRLGVYAMAVGTLAGTATSVLISYRLAPYRPRLVLDGGAISPLLHFGRWILLAGMFAMGSELAMRAIVSNRLGTAELGLYFLAASLALLPNQTVGAVVGAVAFPIHTRFQHDAERAALAFRASLSAMAALLGPVYVLLFVLAPRIVPEMLGPRWNGSVPILRWLSVGGLIGALFAASAPLLEGMGRPKYVAWLYGAFCLSVAVLAWPLVGKIGLPGAGIAYVAAEVVALASAAAFVHRVVPRVFAGLAKPLGAIGIASLAAGLTAGVLSSQVGGLLGTVGSLLIGATISVSVLYQLDRRLDLGFVEYLGRAYPQLGGLLDPR